jgi:hypothetical protein
LQRRSGGGAGFISIHPTARSTLRSVRIRRPGARPSRSHSTAARDRRVPAHRVRGILGPDTAVTGVAQAIDTRLSPDSREDLHRARPLQRELLGLAETGERRRLDIVFRAPMTTASPSIPPARPARPHRSPGWRAN